MNQERINVNGRIAGSRQSVQGSILIVFRLIKERERERDQALVTITNTRSFLLGLNNNHLLKADQGTTTEYFWKRQTSKLT